MTIKKTNVVDEIVDLDLPTDADIRKETWTTKRSANPEYREKLKQANKARSQDPEWIEKTRLTNVKKSQDPVWRQSMKNAAEKRKQDPVWIAKHQANIKKMHADPEYRRRQQELKQTPEWQAANRRGAEKRKGVKRPNTSAKQKARFQDPEVLRKHIENVTSKRYVYVKTPMGVYQNLQTVADIFQVNVNTIHRYLDKYSELFSRISKEEYEQLSSDSKYKHTLVDKDACLELIKQTQKIRASIACTKRSADPEYRKLIGPGKKLNKK